VDDQLRIIWNEVQNFEMKFKILKWNSKLLAVKVVEIYTCMYVCIYLDKNTWKFMYVNKICWIFMHVNKNCWKLIHINIVENLYM